MKLTKLQRYICYILLREEIGKPKNKSRLCHLIFYLFGISNKGFDDNWTGQWFWKSQANSIGNVLDYFPELNDKEPKYGWHNTATDAEGKEMRRAILDKCIEETHP